MNIYNVVISSLIFITACTVLYFTVQADDQKVRLTDRGEIESEAIVNLARAYDQMMKVDQSEEISASNRLRMDTLTLHEGPQRVQNIAKLTRTLEAMNALYDLSSGYHKNLIATVLTFAEELKLEVVSTQEKAEAFKKQLEKSSECEVALEQMFDEIRRLNDRDNNLFEQVKTIAEKLKAQTESLEGLRSIDGEYKTVFDNLYALIAAQKERKSNYENALSSIASAAGVGAPMLGGEAGEVNTALAKMVSDIEAKYGVISQKQGELDSLNAEIASLEGTKTERETTIASLEEKKSGLNSDIKGLRSQIWEPDEGDPIPYIIQYKDYNKKYELVRGQVISVTPQMKMLQLDIGRALVVEQTIGTTGKTNKILCPILSGYEIEIVRPDDKGTIEDPITGKRMSPVAKVRIGNVSEYSAIADILSANKGIRVGDVAYFSAPVIEKIHTDLGGAVEAAPGEEEAAPGASGGTFTEDEIFE